MALFTERQIRERGKAELSRKFTKTASDILSESARDFHEFRKFDIFLSHSFLDAELILGTKKTLEDFGFSTYVDWINDPQLDRSKVDKKTAERIKQRLRTCKSLLYVTTENSKHSKWMPWECGYFDGFKDKVAILPITEAKSNYYIGREYLSLYPYCEKANSTRGEEKLWIYKDFVEYTLFDHWLNTETRLINWKN